MGLLVKAVSKWEGPQGSWHEQQTFKGIICGDK